jgi:hypothetical protein
LKREKLLKGGKGREWLRSNFHKEAGFISA